MTTVVGRLEQGLKEVDPTEPSTQRRARAERLALDLTLDEILLFLME